jgi:hypothetical protein
MMFLYYFTARFIPLIAGYAQDAENAELDIIFPLPLRGRQRKTAQP